MRPNVFLEAVVTFVEEEDKEQGEGTDEDEDGEGGGEQKHDEDQICGFKGRVVVGAGFGCCENRESRMDVGLLGGLGRWRCSMRRHGD